VTRGTDGRTTTAHAATDEKIIDCESQAHHHCYDHNNKQTNNHINNNKSYLPSCRPYYRLFVSVNVYNRLLRTTTTSKDKNKYIFSSVKRNGRKKRFATQ
jgi:hypothetical protein